MKVERNFTVRKKVIDLLRQDRFPPKTFSVTRLTCCPRKTYWRMSGIELKYPDSTILTFTRGRAHHEILEVYEVKEVRIQKDGIRGDIDMIGERVTEIYTTSLGLKRKLHPNYILAKFPIKVLQLTAYCSMMGTTEGDLMVFYLMGDYTRPIKPELEIYTISYTPVETETIWRFLLDRKETIEESLRKDVPPIEKGEDFECTNCPYDYLCQEFGKYVVRLV
jgi:CRISPR/Cas system-associated exonuclease Cas4 (RecB family)